MNKDIEYLWKGCHEIGINHIFSPPEQILSESDLEEWVASFDATISQAYEVYVEHLKFDSISEAKTVLSLYQKIVKCRIFYRYTTIRVADWHSETLREAFAGVLTLMGLPPRISCRYSATGGSEQVVKTAYNGDGAEYTLYASISAMAGIDLKTLHTLFTIRKEPGMDQFVTAITNKAGLFPLFSDVNEATEFIVDVN